MQRSPEIVNDLTNQPPDCQTIALPPNVQVGLNSIINHDERCFARFQSRVNPALLVGENCTLDYVHFALGKAARVEIGNYCYLTSVILLCEQEICIGNYVVLGWNTTIADTDFHPIAPAERIADAIACSPLGKGRLRPPVMRQPVIIEDDVWVGPNVTILKGVRIGAGAWIEAGALVTRNIPPRSRVMGNPAQVIGEVEA
ncbi:acyltransferase [Nostoc sp. UHCC 0251]|uniref:acyltransferase n=1 Tax=Nostoc sp. UHCC 0251 TaxID=3110240 RepID=UPI002B216CCF|nr:acyltransferase [Nostoc sp. UHCC 0251]MEA5626116.1 acyltransferase [Nostoc sp. UHCC 0251]